jgi:hypothetical protein
MVAKREPPPEQHRKYAILIHFLVDEEPDKVVPSANFSITVSTL